MKFTAHVLAATALLARPACAAGSQRRLRAEAEFELPPVSKPVNLAALTDSIQGFFADAPAPGKAADARPLPSQAAIQALASAASATSDTGDAISDFLGDDAAPSTTSAAKSGSMNVAAKATTAAPSAKATTTSAADAAADAISDFLDDDAAAPAKSKVAPAEVTVSTTTTTTTRSMTTATTRTTTTTTTAKTPHPGATVARKLDQAHHATSNPDSKSALGTKAVPDQPSKLKSDDHGSSGKDTKVTVASTVVATRIIPQPAPQVQELAHGEAEQEARRMAVAVAHKAVVAEMKAKSEAKKISPLHAAHRGAQPVQHVTPSHAAALGKNIAAELVRPAAAGAQQHAELAHAPKPDGGASAARRDRFVHHLEGAKEIEAESVGTTKTLRQLAGGKAPSQEVMSAKWTQHTLPRAYTTPVQATTAAAVHVHRTLKSSTATTTTATTTTTTTTTAATLAASTSPHKVAKAESSASKFTTTVEAGEAWKGHSIQTATVKPMESAGQELKAELLHERSLRHRAALVSYSSDWSDEAYEVPVSTTTTTTTITAATTVTTTTASRESRFARRFGFALKSVPWQQTALQPSMTFERTEQEPIHAAPKRLINWEMPFHRFWQYLGLAEPVKAPARQPPKAVAMLQQPVWHVADKEQQNARRTAQEAQEDRSEDLKAESTWEHFVAVDSSIEEDLRDADRSDRLRAETPDAPHVLTMAEIERRDKQDGTVHFSNTWVSLEEQDDSIQKSLNTMGEDIDLNQYGALGRVQDEGMRTLAAQQARADEDAKTSSPWPPYHADTAPEAKMLHDSFEQLQASDEDSEASIRNNPDLKAAM